MASAPTLPADAPLLVARDVTFRYFESEHGVTDVNLQVRRGERILVLGRNGQGKSTLLSLLAGKRKATKGTVLACGADAFDDCSLNDRISLIGTPWPPEAYFMNSVQGITTPAKDPARHRALAAQLHLPLKAMVDKMSAGEKRRVQILFWMRNVAEVLLLDECSTEVDVAERASVLRLAKEETTERGACCLYATHILDGVDDWATRVIVIEGGRIVRDEPYASHLKADKLAAHTWLAKKTFTPFPPLTEYKFDAADTSDKANAICCDGLSYKHIFENLRFAVPRGSRTLLVGCNGSGKSTLLHFLCGKTFFVNKGPALRINGKACYHDMSLNAEVSFGGDWWPKAPDGQMYVWELFKKQPLDAAGEALRQILDVKMDWDIRHVSAGELKRIQLLLALFPETGVVLLDEATADLDLDMRHILLHYLYRRSVEHGVTVLYTTHIFEGLDNWATDCVVLDRTVKGVHCHLRGAAVRLDDIVRTMHQLKAAEAFSLDE